MLTSHFRLQEFACHDGTPVPDVYLGNVTRLADALERLRAVTGPITVLNGYRTSVWNRSVGGVPRSQHLLAKAADVHVWAQTPQRIFELVRDRADHFGFNGLGLYHSFVHLDVRDGAFTTWIAKQP